MAFSTRQVYNEEMKRLAVVTALLLATIAVRPMFSQSFTADTFSGLHARSIGPAVTSGRVMTIAVDPTNTAVFYIGAASGGVWKTANGGASWQPVFDTQGSFSIGWVTIDPKTSERRLGRHRRAQLAAVGRLRRRRLQERGRRALVDEHRPEELRAHRPHRRHPEGQRHRLRRRAGTAVGAGRRSRPLQDDRRRQDLDAGAEDLREHRRHRRRHRSAQSRRRRRGVVPAPAAVLHADQRRTGERDPSQHRRRQDLEEGDDRACRTSSWAESAWRSRR